MVPGIDLADHDETPTCKVSQNHDKICYQLISLKHIKKGENLSINYGPLSNDEFLSDYGFTIDNNNHDKMIVHCDINLINTARTVMNQGCEESSDSSSSINVNGENFSSSSNSNSNTNRIRNPLYPTTPSTLSPPSPLSTLSPQQYMGNEGGQKVNEQYLHQWQLYWLSVLKLYGPNTEYGT